MLAVHLKHPVLHPHLTYTHVQPRPSVPGFAGNCAAVCGERVFALSVVGQSCSQLEVGKEGDVGAWNEKK